MKFIDNITTITSAWLNRVDQTVTDLSISVTDFGAVGNGTTNALAAFTTAYNTAPAGARIRIPVGTYAGVSGTLTGTKFVIWEAQGQPVGGGIWNLPGLIEQGYTTRRISAIEQTVPDGDNKHSFVRDAGHTGGTPGFVCTNVSVNTNAGAANTNFEWGLLSVMNNFAATGENVAIYGQGNRLGQGPTWAGCFEARDKTNLPDPTAGLLGLEVDILANGTDTNNNRIGVDLVVGKGVAGGTAPEAYAALRTNASNGSTTNGEWLHALVVNSAKTSGIRMRQTGKVGIDFSEATFNDTVANTAIRMQSGQKINFSSTLTRTLRYEPATTALRYASGSATLFEIDDTGAVRLSGQLQINGNRVLADRQTGYVAMTGTGNRNTVYDTSTITLPQLAARLLAIQADLTAHGLIGA